MIIQIYINTLGYLGGWSNPERIQKNSVFPISAQRIKQAKNDKNNTDPITVDIPLSDMPLFHNATIGRDSIEIVPAISNIFDVEFGSLKLKFNELQNQDAIDFARVAHAKTFGKETHKLNKDEQMIKELFSVDEVTETMKKKYESEIDKRKTRTENKKKEMEAKEMSI